MKFNEAIKEATIKALKQNKKKLLFGLEVTNQGVGFIEKFPNQVFETPVSELSQGLIVGLASRGFKPAIVYGRIEFALLAMDQILTQQVDGNICLEVIILVQQNSGYDW